MPAKLIAHKREYQPPAEQEQAAPVARRPRLEADEDEPMETGRPYQGFVESEARKYWEDMVKPPRSLTKPNQQKLRAAAMPILLEGLRKRSGARFLPPTVKAHMAVNFMHQRASDRGETKRPYKGPYPNSDYMEALIQYADDTRLSPQEFPLPEHEGPQHPPIYYYIDPVTRQPTPMEDALIRGSYVKDGWGIRLTDADHIHPWPGTGRSVPQEKLMKQKGWNVCYELRFDWQGDVDLWFYWIPRVRGIDTSLESASIHSLAKINFFPS